MGHLVIYLQLLLLQAELVAPSFDAVSEYLDFGDSGFAFGLQPNQVLTHLGSPFGKNYEYLSYPTTLAISSYR